MAEVNIDAELVWGAQAKHHVKMVQEQMVELTNGCICCTLRDDLIKVMAGPHCLYCICQHVVVAKAVVLLSLASGICCVYQHLGLLCCVCQHVGYVTGNTALNEPAYALAANAPYLLPLWLFCMLNNQVRSGILWLQEVAEMAAAGRFDYLVVESTGMPAKVHLESCKPWSNGSQTAEHVSSHCIASLFYWQSAWA